MTVSLCTSDPELYSLWIHTVKREYEVGLEISHSPGSDDSCSNSLLFSLPPPYSMYVCLCLSLTVCLSLSLTHKHAHTLTLYVTDHTGLE